MVPNRRDYALSTDQPILRRNRRRRKAAPDGSLRTEADFWLHFDLDKLARDWRKAGRQAPAE